MGKSTETTIVPPFFLRLSTACPKKSLTRWERGTSRPSVGLGENTLEESEMQAGNLNVFLLNGPRLEIRLF
jgi:hypothetical protein